MTLIPNQFADFKNLHRNQSIIVCGCGRSLKNFQPPDGSITIGVNDVERHFTPDYLVVLNSKNQFKADRFHYVENSNAKALFTQLKLNLSHKNVVNFQLGRRGDTDYSGARGLPYTRNSPYVATCLAAFMGAKRIGLIGVDFSDNHFFADTGRHPLNRNLNAINGEYQILATSLATNAIELVNLSNESRLSGVPRMSTQDFFASKSVSVVPEESSEKSNKPLNIVSYATTPVAGVPEILARCINESTPHKAVCVWKSNDYGNGVIFNSAIEWQRNPKEAIAHINAADLVIVHNGKVATQHQRLLSKKAVITMAHNYLWNVDQQFVRRGLPGLVVAQYQATLKEFNNWSPVPNPIPNSWLNSADYKKNTELTICYTPSAKKERYDKSHRLYWHSKGYRTTTEILNRLQKKYQIKLEVIKDKQVSHSQSLEMKRRAHIVIDECVTGSYHRNSLEGLAMGCVVVNGWGILPDIKSLFTEVCLDENAGVPFVPASLESLETDLERLIQKGISSLTEKGNSNKQWMQKFWSFEKQWQFHWEPAIKEAMQMTNNGVRYLDQKALENKADYLETNISQPVQAIEKTGVSVVIPHGGHERLSHLKACVDRLRKIPEVNEIIIAESDQIPQCYNELKSLADKVIFVQNRGLFQRGKALNVGSAIAEYSHILWLDNDLLLPLKFISESIKELNKSRADVLVPYSCIEYLSEAHSEELIKGRKPRVLSSFKRLQSGRDIIGGATLVKRSFIQRYGGFESEFEGWGGEDNAWHHKASLLGRVVNSKNKKQVLQHLFHKDCGANDQGVSSIKSNPKYNDNLTLLEKIKKIKSKPNYLDSYPPEPFPLPFLEPSKVYLIQSEEGKDVKELADFLHRSFNNYLPNKSAIINLETVDIESIETENAALIFITYAEPSNAGMQKIHSLINRGERGLEVYFKESVLARKGLPLTAVRVDDQSTTFRKAGDHYSPWPKTLMDQNHFCFFTLIQALSYTLSESLIISSDQLSESECASQYPIWLYWEGPEPEWVLHCRKSILANAPNVRLLDAQSFEKLRTQDLDISLNELSITSKSDYIRAYLLRYYGGFWLDSDCILTKNIAPLIEKLGQKQFIAHRERSGLFSNAFIGAPLNSQIALRFYQRICSVLRSRKTLGWTSLGSQPLTAVLNSAREPWLEIQCEHVQPICWSQPDVFYKRDSQSNHEAQFNKDAWCYMLSNEEIKKYERSHKVSLTAEGSYFNYLLHISSTRPEPRYENSLDKFNALPTSDYLNSVFLERYKRSKQKNEASVSGPGSNLERTKAIREQLPTLFRELNISSLVDAGCGDLYWFNHIVNNLESYTGLDIVKPLIDENIRRYSTKSITFKYQNLVSEKPPKADMILARDFLVHLPFDAIFEVLKNFKESGARYLLMTTFVGYRENYDVVAGDWRPINFLLEPFNFSTPTKLIYERCDEAGGQFIDKCLGLWEFDNINL